MLNCQPYELSTSPGMGHDSGAASSTGEEAPWNDHLVLTEFTQEFNNSCTILTNFRSSSLTVQEIPLFFLSIGGFHQSGFSDCKTLDHVSSDYTYLGYV